MSPTGTQTVALYLLDYDQKGRSESVQVADDSNAAIGAPIAVSGTNFANGEYLIWSISGEVHIKITLVGGPNAVASGIFFGENSAMPPPATSGAYLFQKSATLAFGVARLTFTLPAGTYIVQITANAFSNTAVDPGTPEQILVSSGPLASLPFEQGR